MNADESLFETDVSRQHEDTPFYEVRVVYSGDDLALIGTYTISASVPDGMTVRKAAFLGCPEGFESIVLFPEAELRDADHVDITVFGPTQNSLVGLSADVRSVGRN